MEQPQLPGHPAKGISLLSVSYLLERLSYYGFRSIIVLFFVNNLQLEKRVASEWYGLFTGGVYLSVLLGALLGDLLIGAPAAIIAGGILEALGCFCVAIPGGEYTTVAGLFFIALGVGLFKPNMMSQVSSIYKSRVRYMDAGFSIIYFAINVGAFLGPMIIAMLGEQINYSVGFCAAGVVALVSTLPVLLDYKNQQNSFVLKKQSKATVDARSVISLIGLLLLLPVFWAIFETIGSFAYSYNQGSYFDAMLIPMIVLTILTVLSAILWSFVKVDSRYKIGLGFLLLLIPLWIIPFFPEWTQHVPLLSTLPEVLISIPAFTIIARFAPPKLTGLFFAISMSLSFLTSRLSSLFGDIIMTDQTTAVYLFAGICVAAAVLFFILAMNLQRQKE